MKGTSGFLLSQFIIDENGSIYSHFQNADTSNRQQEMEKLRKQLLDMGEKDVLVPMPEGNNNIYVAYFKNKVHIGCHKNLSDPQLAKIKELLLADLTIGKHHSKDGQLQATLNIKSDFCNISILVAKSAINTLAFIKGEEYLKNTEDFSPCLKKQGLILTLIFQRKSSPINGKYSFGDGWWNASSLGSIIPDGSAKVMKFPFPQFWLCSKFPISTHCSNAYEYRF